MIYDGKANISKHFKMYEIIKSDSAARLGIENVPTELVLLNAHRVATEILEPIRDHYGIPFSPNSWYRCEELEREITKRDFPVWCEKHNLPVNDQSWAKYFALKSHPKGEAVDVEVPGISNEELFEWVQKNVPVYDQVIREFYKANNPMSGWVHVSIRESNNRKQVLRIGG